MSIHPTAVVSRGAHLAQDVQVGPYACIGENVTIGKGTVVGSHVVIEGHTTIGENNRIHPFVTLGTPPQDMSYRGEDTRLVIGNENVIREYVSVHRATTKESWETTVGDHNYLMAYAHVAHDCHVGNHVVMANVASLAGHTTVGDHAILGGFVGVHQFVRIGPHAFLGAKSGIDKDVPPYMITSGHRAKLYGVNRVGLARSGFEKDRIDGLKKAFRIIWRDNRRFREGIRQVREELPPFPELEVLLSFFEGSKRGIMR